MVKSLKYSYDQTKVGSNFIFLIEFIIKSVKMKYDIGKGFDIFFLKSMMLSVHQDAKFQG